jgi:hypothetical protein
VGGWACTNRAVGQQAGDGAVARGDVQHHEVEHGEVAVARHGRRQVVYPRVVFLRRTLRLCALHHVHLVARHGHLRHAFGAQQRRQPWPLRLVREGERVERALCVCVRELPLWLLRSPLNHPGQNLVSLHVSPK